MPHVLHWKLLFKSILYPKANLLNLTISCSLFHEVNFSKHSSLQSMYPYCNCNLKNGLKIIVFFDSFGITSEKKKDTFLPILGSLIWVNKMISYYFYNFIFISSCFIFAFISFIFQSLYVYFLYNSFFLRFIIYMV